MQETTVLSGHQVCQNSKDVRRTIKTFLSIEICEILKPIFHQIVVIIVTNFTTLFQMFLDTTFCLNFSCYVLAILSFRKSKICKRNAPCIFGVYDKIPCSKELLKFVLEYFINSYITVVVTGM